MTDIKRAELAIRRAASQIPSGWARVLRLVADEMKTAIAQPDHMVDVLLDKYRNEDAQRE